MKIKDKILKQLAQMGDLSVKELTDMLNVSKQAIHIALIQLQEAGAISKFGKAPKTIYRLKSEQKPIADNDPVVDSRITEFLQKHFLLISETGEMKEGVQGFKKWCQQRKLPLEKTISEFIKTKEKYSEYYDEAGFIEGIGKIKNTKGYEKIYLDQLYYLDFYAIERFGKTRLGTILHYAKQGQNKFLMQKLVTEVRPMIERLVQNERFNAVGYVPPTIRREVQLMKYLETHLKINLPKINILKISGIIPVPQKSLNKIEERISNAENTFAVNDTVRYRHVLLLDDAVGSGSTLNQIAGKLKKKSIATKVTGVALVGSFKGFDVITDV